MGLSEALSDNGTVTGRGGPLRRGRITGVGTASGGMPSHLSLSLSLSHSQSHHGPQFGLYIAFIRYRFMGGKLINTIVQVVIGGALVFGIGVLLGRIGAS
jgi:hypothetical protein